MADDDQENWGRFLGIGLEMAVGVGLGLAVGWWLDKKYGWTPVATLIGALIGLAGGVYLVIKDALKMNSKRWSVRWMIGMPLMVAGLAGLGYGASRAAGFDSHARELVVAAIISVVAAELALVPLMLVRGGS